MTEREILAAELMRLVSASGLGGVIILVDEKQTCLMTNLPSKEAAETLTKGCTQLVVEQPLPDLGRPN